MSCELGSSEQALAQAIIQELDKADGACGNPQHGTIHISCEAAFMRNGIKYCSVQIECEAGCGWLVQAFGDEAVELEHKINTIQRLLDCDIEGVPMPLCQILLSCFPRLTIEDRPTITKNSKELFAQV